MHSPIRALVVADAVAARRCVSEALASEPGIEVIGTAANRKIGESKLAMLQPDVVTVASEMAENGALEMIRAVRQSHPRIPVIVVSSSRAPGHGVLRDLLAAGASACITPADYSDRTSIDLSIRAALIPKIKVLCTRVPDRLERIEIVAIGISTGGPNALPELLAELPSDFPVPIVIVQHMPPVFTSRLAERLNTKCALAVSEAVADKPLRAGHVYLAPGDRHMLVVPSGASAHFVLNQDAPENSCRPSADPLFRSVAAMYGSRALGIIMTGMGRDGLKGCESLREAGAQILAQDEATSVVWGMPGSVVRAGLADAVLPLGELAGEVLRRAQIGRKSRLTGAAHAS